MQGLLQRSRRQFSDLRRSNFARRINAILATNDPAVCVAACEAYATNERSDARDNPNRGPNRRNQFFRSGGTSLTRRYNRLFLFLQNLCMGGFCARLASESDYSYVHNIAAWSRMICTRTRTCNSLVQLCKPYIWKLDFHMQTQGDPGDLVIPSWFLWNV